jgi:hypothetical protein
MRADRGKQQDKCLNGGILYPLKRAQFAIEKWRIVDTALQPH